jgi:acetyl esterase/lipase
MLNPTPDLFEPADPRQPLLKASLRLFLRLLFRGLMRPAVPLALQRRIIRILTALTVTPPGVRREEQCINGVPCEWQRSGSASGRVMLYLHGGAFIVGSPATHRAITRNLAARAELDVCVVDYRLAPEHAYPAAPDDCLAVYRGLLAAGVKPDQLCLAGDSAGGNLVLLTLLRVREMGLPLPAAAVCLSPLTDLGDAFLHVPPAGDPMLTASWLAYAAQLYCPSADQHSLPGLSPLQADLSGLPALLIQVGEDELLRDHSLVLAERARNAGVEVCLQRYAGLWHVFQAHAGMLQSADLALQRVADFLRARLG